MGASTLSLQPKRRPDRPFRRLRTLNLVAGLPAGIGSEPRTLHRALLRDLSQPLERDFLAHSKRTSSVARLVAVALAIFLRTGDPKTPHAARLMGALPADEFLHRKCVARAGLFESEKSAFHRRHHFGLPPDGPSDRVSGWQSVDGEFLAEGPDDVGWSTGHDCPQPGAGPSETAALGVEEKTHGRRGWDSATSRPFPFV